MVRITSGIEEGDQLDTFQNATLFGVGDDLAVSIAARVAVPEDVAEGGEAAVVTYLNEALTAATTAVPQLSFEVQVGPTMYAPAGPVPAAAPEDDDAGSKAD